MLTREQIDKTLMLMLYNGTDAGKKRILDHDAALRALMAELVEALRNLLHQVLGEGVEMTQSITVAEQVLAKAAGIKI